MKRKLPSDAFDYYVGLNEQRSYVLVAGRFGVSTRAVTKCAKRERWTQRLAEINAKAQEKADKKHIETKVEMRERHIKMVKAIQQRGIQALQATPLDDAMEGVKALELAIKLERVIMGEPSERVGVSIQEQMRREVETFLARSDGPEDEDDEDLEDEGPDVEGDRTHAEPA